MANWVRMSDGIGWVADAGVYLPGAPWPVYAPRVPDRPTHTTQLSFHVGLPPPGGDIQYIEDYDFWDPRPYSDSQIYNFGDPSLGFWNSDDDNIRSATYPPPNKPPAGSHLYLISYNWGPGGSVDLIPSDDPLTSAPSNATAQGKGSPWTTSFTDGWEFSPNVVGSGGLIADAGEYSWVWPVWPPPPQNLPIEAGEIDYIVARPHPSGNPDDIFGTRAGNFDDGTPSYSWAWRFWAEHPPYHEGDETRSGYTSVRGDGGVGGEDPSQPPHGAHLFVVWYDQYYSGFGSIDQPTLTPQQLAPFDAVPGGGGWSRGLGGPSEWITDTTGSANVSGGDIRVIWGQRQTGRIHNSPTAEDQINQRAMLEDCIADMASGNPPIPPTYSPGYPSSGDYHDLSDLMGGAVFGGIGLQASRLAGRPGVTPEPIPGAGSALYQQTVGEIALYGYALKYVAPDPTISDYRFIPYTVEEDDRVPYPNSPDGAGVFSEAGAINTLVGWLDYSTFYRVWDAKLTWADTYGYPDGFPTGYESTAIDHVPYDITVMPRDWTPANPGVFSNITSMADWAEMWDQPVGTTVTAPVDNVTSSGGPVKYVDADDVVPLSRVGAQEVLWIALMPSWATGRVSIPSVLADIPQPSTPGPGQEYHAIGWTLHTGISLPYSIFVPGPNALYRAPPYQYWVPGPYIPPEVPLRMGQRDDGIGMNSHARLINGRSGGSMVSLDQQPGRITNKNAYE